jgi:hypothetical protein
MSLILTVFLIVQFLFVLFISNNIRMMSRNEQAKQFRENILEGISNCVKREVELYSEEELATPKVREYFDRIAERRVKVLNTVSHSDMVNSFKTFRVSSFYNKEQQEFMFYVETQKKALI